MAVAEPRDALLKDISVFRRSSSLKRTAIHEKNTLPTVQTLYEEMLPDTIEVRKELGEIKKFVQSKLAHVEVGLHDHLPTKQEIEDEKTDSRAYVKEFDKSKLHHVQVEEHNPLPTANVLREELLPDCLPTKKELAQLKTYVRSYLHHVDSKVKDHLPTKEELQQEAVNKMTEVTKFNKRRLSHVETVEKNPLPKDYNLFADLLPDQLPSRPDINALQAFLHDRLRHVETFVHSKLPSSEQIQQEKESITHKIEDFKKEALHHVETVEKNTLPDESVLRSELLPDYLPSRKQISALLDVVRNTLKHVEMKIKDRLPTSEDIREEKLSSNAAGKN